MRLIGIGISLHVLLLRMIVMLLLRVNVVRLRMVGMMTGAAGGSMIGSVRHATGSIVGAARNHYRRDARIMRRDGLVTDHHI